MHKLDFPPRAFFPASVKHHGKLTAGKYISRTQRIVAIAYAQTVFKQFFSRSKNRTVGKDVGKRAHIQQL